MRLKQAVSYNRLMVVGQLDDVVVCGISSKDARVSNIDCPRGGLKATLLVIHRHLCGCARCLELLCKNHCARRGWGVRWGQTGTHTGKGWENEEHTEDQDEALGLFHDWPFFEYD